jgi:predicted O-methyltransferase YrrM
MLERQMKKRKYSDKMLPTQEFFSYMYEGSVPIEAALYSCVASYALDFDASQFKLRTPDNLDFEEMSTPPWQLTLFNTIIGLIGAKTVLEIGTFIGHSAMQFARMVGDDGHVTTIELGNDFAKIANENFKANGLDRRITLINGDAGKILDGLPADSFDLVFVDGGKQDYLSYTLKAERLLSQKGVIIVDDVFFHGDALNDQPTTEKGRGCKDLLDYFAKDLRFCKLLLPVGNGLLILFKKKR